MSNNGLLEVSHERFRPDEMSMREAPVDNLSPILTQGDNDLFFSAKGGKKGKENDGVLGDLISEVDTGYKNFANFAMNIEGNAKDEVPEAAKKSEKGNILDFGDMASLYGLKEVEQRRNIDNYTRGASAEQRAIADENTFQHVFGKAA